MKFWEDIFPSDEVVKMLTMPYYFPEQLHWEKRRGLLLEICGNISDLAIMESDTELAELPDLLGRQTVDEFKKSIKSQRAEINRNITMIPARIDEATKAIPDTSSFSEEELKKELSVVRKTIAEATYERSAIITNGNTASAIRNQIADLQATLSEARKAYTEKEHEASKNTFEKVQKLKEELSSARNDHSENMRLRKEKRFIVANIEDRRNKILDEHRQLQEEYNKVFSETFDESSVVCDKCGQELPRHKVMELVEQFNERKSNTLESLRQKMNALVENGKKTASKEMLATAKQEVTAYDELIEGNEGCIVLLEGKLEEAQKERDAVLSMFPSFESTTEYSEIQDRIVKLCQLEQTSAPDTSEIDDKIAKYRSRENEITEILAYFETERVQRERISELEKQEKELGTKYEETEKALYLCEKFTRVKSSLLNDRINENFLSVKFQLFKQNITNDGIEDTCEVLVPTDSGAYVPFSDANKAARLNAGIEIISVIGRFYGIELPIFVDNAESVSHIVPTECQLIRLVVSENDKELRLETY